MNGAPVLTDSDIEYLLCAPKLVLDSNWRIQLLQMRNDGSTWRGRLDLDDLPSGSHVRGRLHMYTRRNLAIVDDWSTGLVFTDYADNSYRLIRCNGPHPAPHHNVIEGTSIIRAPHIHRLTERYQRRKRVKPDGFAEPTDAYADLRSAIEHLAGLVTLTAAGRLFL